ncbi:MAG TPA: MASE1 domain-containing protein [Candidatus Angelobacter sp.]|nr:MASE1 domain-containing protein [Candidatus Angelobacter sp.]
MPKVDFMVRKDVMTQPGHAQGGRAVPDYSRSARDHADIDGLAETEPLSLSAILKMLVFAVAILLAYRFGSPPILESPGVLSLPVSVLLCALLLVPLRRWWIYLAIAALMCLLVDQWKGNGWTLPAIFPYDAFQATISAYALRRFARGRFQMDGITQFGAFCLIAVVAAPALAGLGWAFASYNGNGHFLQLWVDKFLCRSVSAVVVTPAIFCWTTLHRRGTFDSAKKFIEAVVLLGGLFAASFMAFGRTEADPGQTVAVLYAPFPFLLWLALRFGLTGASTGISLVGVLAMLSALHGRGPFLADSPHDNVMGMRLFLMVISVPLLLLAILFEERRRAENELHISYQQIRRLSASLLNAHDDERRRVARELHDEVCQEMTAVIMSIDGLKQQSPTNSDMQTDLTSLGWTVSRLSKRIHGLSRQLHPSLVEYMGLSGALTLLCRESEALYPIQVTFTDCKLASGLSLDCSVCLFMVAQEGLRNAMRHSHCNVAMVELTNNENHVQLYVRDSGRGFNVNDPKRKRGLGFVQMEERVRGLKGNIRIRSAPGKGTEIMVEMPLAKSDLQDTALREQETPTCKD